MKGRDIEISTHKLHVLFHSMLIFFSSQFSQAYAKNLKIVKKKQSHVIKNSEIAKFRVLP